MSDPAPIWKKETRLGGSREQGQSESGESTSIWKKEIRVGRRPRLEAAVEDAMKTDPAEPVSSAELTIGKQSLWKKEFHIGSAPGDHPSFWKKDIRLLAPGKGNSDPGALIDARAPARVEEQLEAARRDEPGAEPHVERAPPRGGELGGEGDPGPPAPAPA